MTQSEDVTPDTTLGTPAPGDSTQPSGAPTPSTKPGSKVKVEVTEDGGITMDEESAGNVFSEMGGRSVPFFPHFGFGV